MSPWGTHWAARVVNVRPVTPRSVPLISNGASPVSCSRSGRARPPPAAVSRPSRSCCIAVPASRPCSSTSASSRTICACGETLQRAHNPLIPQRMLLRDVRGYRRVGTPGDNHPHAFGRHSGQQRRDAVRVWATCYTLVLFHHPSTSRTSRSPIRSQAAAASSSNRPNHPCRFNSVNRIRNRLPGHLRQLLEHHLQERGPVTLTRIASGDKERHHTHPGRRMQHKPRHQRRLARPRRTLPPYIRAAI